MVVLSRPIGAAFYFLKSESQFSTSVMGAVVSGGVPRAIMNLLPSRDTS